MASADGTRLIASQKHRNLHAPFYCSGSGIYAIINRNNQKIYVGSGKRLNCRWNVHRCELENGKHGNRYLQRAFQKEPDAFYIELIEELDNPTKEILLGREQFWMDFYQSYNPSIGYNIAPKAESCQGIKRDPEFVARVAASMKGKKFSKERLEIHRNRKKPTKFRKFTPEQRAERSLLYTGRKLTKEHALNISKALKANPPRAKPVLQYTMQGDFVKRFKSILKAKQELGCCGTSIGSVCAGKNRSAGGFYWKYASDDPPEKTVKVPEKRHGGFPRRPVFQFTLDGKFIRSYACCDEAAKIMGISESRIRSVCAFRRKCKTAKGFIWRFTETLETRPWQTVIQFV